VLTEGGGDLARLNSPCYLWERGRLSEAISLRLVRGGADVFI